MQQLLVSFFQGFGAKLGTAEFRAVLHQKGLPEAVNCLNDPMAHLFPGVLMHNLLWTGSIVSF